jgi:hypothetical protein
MIRREGMASSWLSLETRAGRLIQIRGVKVIPFSQTLVIRLPFIHGGLVWNRPAALWMQNADGQEQIVPVRDITRMRVLTWLGVGLLGSSLAWLALNAAKK